MSPTALCTAEERGLPGSLHSVFLPSDGSAFAVSEAQEKLKLSRTRGLLTAKKNTASLEPSFDADIIFFLIYIFFFFFFFSFRFFYAIEITLIGN
jgi:hypothetical protein